MHISTDSSLCWAINRHTTCQHTLMPIFDMRSLQSMDCPEHRRVSVLLGISTRHIANIIEYIVKISTQGTVCYGVNINRLSIADCQQDGLATCRSVACGSLSMLEEYAVFFFTALYFARSECLTHTTEPHVSCFKIIS